MCFAPIRTNYENLAAMASFRVADYTDPIRDAALDE